MCNLHTRVWGQVWPRGAESCSETSGTWASDPLQGHWLTFVPLLLHLSSGGKCPPLSILMKITAGPGAYHVFGISPQSLYDYRLTCRPCGRGARQRAEFWLTEAPRGVCI